MLLTTKGIVLRFVKYRESSIIATIYTEKEGIVSVIANSVRSKNSKGKIALFQPMSLVELVIYFNASKNINRISEIRSYHPLHKLRQGPIKSAIAIFLTEMLNKCLKEEVGNTSLYNFLQDSIIQLNDQEDSINDFHMVFLHNLSRYLGFKPASVDEYVEHITNKSFYNEEDHKHALLSLMSGDYGTQTKLNSSTRQIFLADLLEYYQNHTEIGKIKSVEILHELLHS